MMATRSERLAEFLSEGRPPAQACEVLCEDHNGTYSPRFLCRFSDGIWRNAETGIAPKASVIGWRVRK